MSREDFNHYRVLGGELKQAIVKFREDVQDASLTAAGVCKMCGAEGTIAAFKTTGLRFKNDKCPEGWRKIGLDDLDKRPYFMPYRRSKAGKEIYDQISSIPVPSRRDLSVAICGVDRFFVGFDASSGGFKIGSAYAVTRNKVTYVGIPKCEEMPSGFKLLDDHEPMPLSEVYALIEDEVAA